MPGFKLKADKFKQIRMLLDSKSFTHQQISEITGWSTATISYVARVKTYDEYVAMMQTLTEAKRIRYGAAKEIKKVYANNLEKAKTESGADEKVEPKPVGASVDYAEAYLERLVELMKENNKLLTQMATLWGLPKEDNGDGVINMNLAGYKPF